MNALKNYRVLVTPNSFGKHNKALKQELEALVGEVVYNTTGKPLTSAQVQNLLPGIDGYIAGLDQIDAQALQAANSLKVIVRYGAGVDQVDLDTATAKGIVVSNTPGANSASVAELALGLLLMLVRQIPAATSAIQRGEWPRLPGLTLEGKTIGIIGLGAIGKHFAQRLSGFDCHIIAHDPFADMVFVRQRNIELAPLADLLSRSDFISLHCPVLPNSEEIIIDGLERKQLLKSGLPDSNRRMVAWENYFALVPVKSNDNGAEHEWLVQKIILPKIDTTSGSGYTRRQTFECARICISFKFGF